MATMNISLPDSMKEFVESEVSVRGYGNTSEYVRDLIRRDQDRQRFTALVVEGMQSGPGPVMDDAYFARLRERINDKRDG